ncbi:MAG: sugar phosphate nucleotidyltransferase [bacterium]
MQVVILAGGLGTRLRGAVPNIPKALVPLAGKPFIEHQFDLLRPHGLLDVLLCVGHRAEQIEKHLGDGTRFGFRVRYSREDPARLLGTGGALVNAIPVLEEEFLLLYGDSYLPTDYRAVCEAFRRCGTAAMMSVFRNKGKWDDSNTRIADGKVVFYSKSAGKGEADYIDYGLSAFRRDVISRYRGSASPLDLARIQTDLVAGGELAAFEVAGRFYEIGKPDGLAELDRVLCASGREQQ